MVNINNSLSSKLLSMLLAISVLLGALPITSLSVFAITNTNVAQIGDTYYGSLDEAIASVPSGSDCVTPETATEIKLLTNTESAFDVGKSNGSVTKNISIDLGGNTLTLKPAVGSVGTVSNGIRVLAFSKLTISNGTIACSDETDANIKTGIANYSDLTLKDVTVKSGALTHYTINNRGKLTLLGKTTVENGKVAPNDYSVNEGKLIAITNDPYNLYYTTNVDATIICDSADVSVGTVQIERYERKSSNKGVVKLDISNGNFDRIVEDGNNSVNVSYDLTGGTIGLYNGDELTNALNMVTPGAEYVCPENSVTIKLMGDGTFEGGFDVGTSNGKAPKNIVLDLNGKSLTLKPAVGSVGTVSNGIRVLAYSKLHIKNGALICPDDVDDNIKTGIANYSDLTLEGVTVKSGALTCYTINNRGKLTLLGKTTVENGQVAPNDYDDMTGELVAITNDPYTTYQTTNENNASLICKSKNVVVGNIQLECYGKSNKSIILDIANGTFGKIMQPKTSGNITVNSTKFVGGTFANDVSEYLPKDEYGIVFDESTQTYAVQKLTEVTDFAFETADPKNQWVGTKYTNIAKSKTSNGKVSYEISSGTDVATINSDSGEVTFNKLGKITVTAKLEKTDKYKSATAEYTVTSVKKDQDDFAFKTTNPVITYDSKNFSYKNEIKNIVGKGKITYEIISGSDVADIDSITGELTIKKAGSVTVKATKSEDDLYNKAEASYTLTINRAEQSVLTVTAPETITYHTNAQSVLEVSGGNGDGKVSYSIIEGSQFATIDPDAGEITTKKASETAGGPCGVVTIQVDKAGDDCYNAATPVTVEITINYADQTGFGFEKTDEEVLTIIYNDNGNKFTNKASGGQSTGETTYEIVSGSDVADIDSKTGELTIKKAGNVTVKATKSGDTCYNATDAKYTLKVNPDTPEFTVADNAESVELIYGVKEYDIDVNTTLGGSGKYIYSLDGENKIGAHVNDKYTGKITFGNSDSKVGSITVKVKKEADDCYIEVEKTFTLTISYHIPTAQPTLSGETKNKSGWYTSDVIITAPDEYQISYSNELEGTIWSNCLTVDKEGKNSKKVYLKKGDEISGAISFDDIKIDKSAPYDVVLKYSESVNVIDKLFNVITFGFYSSEKPLIVTVSAKDNIDIEKIECVAYDVTEGSDKGVESIKLEKQLVPDETGKYGTTSGHIQFKVDPQYRGKIKTIVYDYAGNTTEVTENENGFDEVVVDTIAPEVKVEFTGSLKDKIDVDVAGQKPTRQTKNTTDANTRFVYDGDITATITVKEANFFNDMIITVYRDGKEVTDFKSSDWKQTDGTLEYVKTVTMSEDGDYQIQLDYKDKSENKMNVDATSEYADKKLEGVETYTSNIHNIDTTLPTYSIEYDNKSVVENFNDRDYFDANRTATIKVTDRNFRPNEVDFKADAKDSNGDNVSEFTHSKLTDWKEWTYDGEDTWKAEVSFNTDANYDVTFNYKDIAENEIEQSYSTKFTVDTKSSEIDITYIADNGNTSTHYTKDDSVDVANFKSATQVYYNGKVTAKITVNESNFFEGDKYTDETNVHKIGILLTKIDNDGNITKTEYLPENSEQFFAVEATNTEIVKWNTDATNKNVHTFEIVYEEDADYVLTVKGTDFSKNVAEIRESICEDKTELSKDNGVEDGYTSKTITVDTIAPEVTVVYDNNDVKATYNARKYFTENRTATITVNEHNFRATDFAAEIVAKYSDNTDVEIADFVNFAKNKDNWVKDKSSDVYTIKLNFTVDANYTFGYTYKDLAQNSVKDYKTEFTVDKKNPENLTVTYNGDVKTTVLDKVLNVITFGYYDAKVKVIITADDAVSGIEHFVYSYVKAEKASDVNAGLENVTINSDNITQDGKTFTASFEIPKDVLQNTNQFNGTVKFTAFDRSARNSERKETSTIVVDNIAPTATITYNEPVQKVNDISYYAGNIDAKIVINEANFNSNEVVVKVNDNAVDVKWTDNSVDVHTGTFTLTKDGDYVVTVEYKDRSANEMAKYTSNRLTLDTKAPTINVTNIKQNSANKDEEYGFTITANDINFDAASFKPVLTATIRNEDGSYGTKTVSLGELKTVEAGKTYTFTVDNLEDDAVYSLVCTIKDMSGNTYSKIALGDGREYENVRFSINRNGSTFAVDNNTDTLINQYYVYSVDENVVIEEVNVDPVETYIVKLNGKVLTEGTDYISNLSDKAGEWSKRTYVISKTLFKAEGEYSIIVESTDKADTTAYSDVKNLNVSFVVDQTAPVLTISGLETGGRYQVEEQTVTVIPTDDGGRLYSIKVIVLNSNGEPLKDANGKDISVRFEMSGEEFLTYLTENNGKIKFTVPEGLENQVQIICNDCATNAYGKTNEYNETYTKVTVSQSGWIIFYANKPLFYGSVAGVIILVGSIIFLIFFKKRKKA